jgi:proline-specific peptidase
MTIPVGEYKLKVKGLELWYKVAGNGPVLMVQPPGWGIGVGYCEQTFQPLESEFTLIYHDTRGSGRSQTPANPEDINVGAFVADLEALRKHLGLDSFALIGHSGGAHIALNYAFKYQRHLSHLLPLSTGVEGEEVEQDFARNLSELAKDARFADAVKARGAFKIGFEQLESDEDLSVFFDRIAHLYFKDPEHEGVAMLREYVRINKISLTARKATRGDMGRFPVRDKLNTIRVPTLVLVGRHDIFCSPMQAQIIHQGIRGSKLAVFENSGHLPWIEEPDLFFSTVTDFLKGKS